MQATARGLGFIKHVIGTHNISAPLSAWEALKTKPYRNSLFTAKIITDNTLQINTDVRATPSLALLAMMNGNYRCDMYDRDNDTIYTNLKTNNKLSAMYGEDMLTLDTSQSNIPGRWACMFHDFYFGGNKSVLTQNYGIYNPNGVLKPEHVAELNVFQLKGILIVKKGPLVPNDFEPSDVAKDMYFKHASKTEKFYDLMGFGYGGCWLTGDGVSTPSVEYFMHKVKMLSSFDIKEVYDQKRYQLANKYEGGILIPHGRFSRTYMSFIENKHELEYKDKDKNDESMEMIVRGLNNYRTNQIVPFEELVILEEAIRLSGGVTQMRTVLTNQEKMDAYYDVKKDINNIIHGYKEDVK